MERLIVEFISNPFVFYTVVFIIVFLIILVFIKLSKNKIKSLNNLNEPLKIDYVKEEKEDDDVNKSKEELESLLEKMQGDLENPKEVVSDDFEKRQEEDSIISYSELLQAKKEGKIEIEDDEKIYEEKPNDYSKLKEELTKEEENSYFDFIDEIDEKVKEEVKAEPKEEPKQEENGSPSIEDMIPNPFDKTSEKKFKTTDVISPIFGYGSSDPLYANMRKKEDVIRARQEEEEKKKSTFSDDELAEIIDFEPEDLENNNEQFLKALKEFRKNLE